MEKTFVDRVMVGSRTKEWHEKARPGPSHPILSPARLDKLLATTSECVTQMQKQHTLSIRMPTSMAGGYFCNLGLHAYTIQDALRQQVPVLLSEKHVRTLILLLCDFVHSCWSLVYLRLLLIPAKIRVFVISNEFTDWKLIPKTYTKMQDVWNCEL